MRHPVETHLCLASGNWKVASCDKLRSLGCCSSKFHMSWRQTRAQWVEDARPPSLVLQGQFCRNIAAFCAAKLLHCQLRPFLKHLTTILGAKRAADEHGSKSVARQIQHIYLDVWLRNTDLVCYSVSFDAYHFSIRSRCKQSVISSIITVQPHDTENLPTVNISAKSNTTWKKWHSWLTQNLEMVLDSREMNNAQQQSCTEEKYLDQEWQYLLWYYTQLRISRQETLPPNCTNCDLHHSAEQSIDHCPRDNSVESCATNKMCARYSAGKSQTLKMKKNVHKADTGWNFTQFERLPGWMFHFRKFWWLDSYPSLDMTTTQWEPNRRTVFGENSFKQFGLIDRLHPESWGSVSESVCLPGIFHTLTPQSPPPVAFNKSKNLFDSHTIHRKLFGFWEQISTLTMTPFASASKLQMLFPWKIQSRGLCLAKAVKSTKSIYALQNCKKSTANLVPFQSCLNFSILIPNNTEGILSNTDKVPVIKELHPPHPRSVTEQPVRWQHYSEIPSKPKQGAYICSPLCASKTEDVPALLHERCLLPRKVRPRVSKLQLPNDYTSVVRHRAQLLGGGVVFHSKYHSLKDSRFGWSELSPDNTAQIIVERCWKTNPGFLNVFLHTGIEIFPR